MTYDQWKTAVLTCKNCNLGKLPNKIKVIGRGAIPCKIMVVGESPGEQEELRGIPFCGQAGALLTQICKIVGFDRETDFYITNAVKCHPPGNKTTNEHVRACNGLFTQELDFVKPDIIVTLGNFATEMFGIDMKITECHGKEFNILENQTILPIYHPAYVLHGGGEMAKTAIIEDFVHLREMVWGVGYKEYQKNITIHSELLDEDLVIGEGGQYSLTEVWKTAQEVMRGDV
jgi:DNA polymerase